MTGFIGKIGHLEGIESPWGNAGGVVKTIEDVDQMAHTGVGWIEAGSYTLEPRVGNSPNGELVYYHNPQTGATFNSLGMPNKGMEEVEKEIPEMATIAHAYNKKLVINVAPVSDKPVGESVELVRRAYQAGADAVLLNAGCPNVVTDGGGRHEILSHNASALQSVLSGLAGVIEQYKPIFLRTSPMGDYGKASWVYGSIPDGLVSAIFTPNTWGGNKPLDHNGEPVLQVPGGLGGKSGPATAGQAQIQANFASNLCPHIDVVRSGGITNASELKRALGSGALAGAGTTFYYESQNGWQDDTARLLTELAG